jgi:hypothetical protein
MSIIGCPYGPFKLRHRRISGCATANIMRETTVIFDKPLTLIAGVVKLNCRKVCVKLFA